MECKYCKHEIEEGDLYCPYCGKSQLESEELHSASRTTKWWWVYVFAALVLLGGAGLYFYLLGRPAQKPEVERTVMKDTVASAPVVVDTVPEEVEEVFVPTDKGVVDTSTLFLKNELPPELRNVKHEAVNVEPSNETDQDENDDEE